MNLCGSTVHLGPYQEESEALTPLDQLSDGGAITGKLTNLETERKARRISAEKASRTRGHEQNLTVVNL